MADIKWIKITTDMFDNRKIKHLRKLPDGNNIVLIWVMLLTMAGRCNSNGMIFLTENIPYTPKMLADELDFEENTVQLALNALEQFNMVVMDRGFFTIAGWQEYQNIEGLDKIREQNRIRKQKQRERQMLLEDVSRDMSRDSNVTVTQSHAIDIEEDKKKDKDVLSKDNTKKKTVKHKHGEFQNVLLTENEFENLANSFGVALRDQAIKFLDEYIEEKGYKSKSHNLAIRRWVIDAVNREKPTQAKNKGSAGSFDTHEFFEAAIARTWDEKEPPKTAADDDSIREKMEALKKKLG